MFTENLWCTRLYAKLFDYIISFNSHNSWQKFIVLTILILQLRTVIPSMIIWFFSKSKGYVVNVEFELNLILEPVY